MKFKLMNGATAMAILGGFGLATPVLAQGINGPQYSTPAEQAETQRLNQQGVNGTTESPAVLNGEVRDAAAPQPMQYDQSGTDYPQAPNNGGQVPGSYGGYQETPAPTYQQQRYNDQMLQYRNEQLRYQDQRNRYEMQRDRYERDRDWYAPPWWYDYP